MPESMTKANYGISGVRAFKITSIGAGGVPVYSTTAIDWKGAREISYKPTGEDQVFYADNTSYLTIRGIKELSGTFTAYTMPNSIKEDGLGYVVDQNKAHIVNGTSKASFGMMYEVEIRNEDGTDDKELHVLFKVTLSDPEVSSKTKEVSLDLKEFTVPFKAEEIVDTTNGLTYAEAVLKKSVVGSVAYAAALAAMYVVDTVV